MPERKVRLMRHNFSALQRLMAAMPAGTSPELLARRGSQILGELTVGRLVKSNGLATGSAGLYPEKAYPNATSRKMLRALTESYRAIQRGNVVIVDDYATDGNTIRFDHICQACSNNQANKRCKLFDRIFMIITDHSRFRD